MDAEYLRKRIFYNHITGEMFWRPATEETIPNNRARSSWNAKYQWKPFGSLSKRGYLVTRIKYKTFTLHRLAWAIYYGDWPEKDIDHINGNKLDNRIENLRDCSRSRNLHNKKYKRNFYRGVYKYKKNEKYYARFKHDKKVSNLGSFNSPVEAAWAYDLAAIECHGNIAQTNFLCHEVFRDK